MNTQPSSVVAVRISGLVFAVALLGLWAGAAAYAAAPANDMFANRISLTGSLPITAAGSNVDATKEANEPATVAGNAGGASVWWTWTAPITGVAMVDTLGSDFDTVLGVYTGSAFPLTLVAANDDSNGTVQSMAEFTATAGVAYQILVDGFNDGNGTIAQGNVTLHVNLSPSPANDNLANAQALTGSLPITVSGTNFGATNEAGEPVHGGVTGGASVWYSWTSPASGGGVTINTEGSNFSTFLAVYTGTTYGTLTEVVSNIQAYGNTFATFSQVTFTAAASTTYSISVDTASGYVGYIVLNLNRPPDNDNFASAIALNSALPVSTTGSNQYASAEAGEPTHGGSDAAASVWWSWTAPASGTVGITTSGSSFPTLLSVYTGNALNSLTSVAESDPFATSELAAQVSFPALSGTTYRIAVDGYQFATGAISLSIGAAPQNDDFANAIALSGSLPIHTTGSNRFATLEGGEPDHTDPDIGSNNGGASVWWSWTASANGKINISTDGSDFYALLAVYTGPDLASLIPVARNALGSGIAGQLTFSAAAGTTYYIAVDGWGDTGNISLAIRNANPPPNDDFAKATVLSGALPLVAQGTNTDASKEAGEPTPAAGFYGGASVWWNYTPQSSGLLVLSTSGSDFYTLMAVYTGANVSSLTLVALTSRGQVAFAATAGTTYHISVDGSFGSTGSIKLALGMPPANDNFANAITIQGSLPIVTTGTNAFASTEPGEFVFTDQNGNPAGASVWWKWIATATGQVTLSTAGSGIDASVAAFTGNAVFALTVVGWPEPAQGYAQFDAVAGTTYYIAVYGNYNANLGAADTGKITFHLTAAPPNDNVADAIALTGALPLAATGTNLGATLELDTSEPSRKIAGSTGGASVWWTWTATASGPVTITTAGSNFHTLLGVYELPKFSLVGFDNLTFIAGDAGSIAGAQSLLTFKAKSGSQYYISVDGPLGEAGSISLTIEPYQLPDLSVSSLAIVSSNTSPKAGEQVTFRAAVRNAGGRCGSFNVGLYLNSAAAPALGSSPDAVARVLSMAPNSSLNIDLSGTAPQVGGYKAWAFADCSDPLKTGTGEVAESDETNNAGPLPSGIPWAVVPPPPVIASAATASGTVGSSFSYTITATNSPTSFAATGLPDGLSVDSSTGAISGTPTAAGSFSATVSAANTGGTGSAALKITIAAQPPAITSALTASALLGAQFSYTITASGTGPLSFSVSSLPPGLMLSGDTITGTPTGYAISQPVILSAVNNAGKDTQTLYLTIGNSSDVGFLSALSPEKVQLLGITSLKLKLDFGKSGNDSITLSGFFPGGASPASQKFMVDLGGLVRTFTLDAKGSGKNGKSESIKVVSKNGSILFAEKLSKGSYSPLLASEGFTVQASQGQKKVNVLPIIVQMGGVTYRKDQLVEFSAQAGKVGSGSGVGTETLGANLVQH